MSLQLFNRLPEKYRFFTFLVITSMIGVTLIMLAVYNASMELERIHAIDNLHRFTSTQLNQQQGDARELLKSSTEDFQYFLLKDKKADTETIAINDIDITINLAELETSRLNEHGGVLDRDDHEWVWTQLQLPNIEHSLLVFHHYQAGGAEPLVEVYVRRLLIPAGFYIWLMVWMAYILNFLTDKLSRQKQEMEHMALHDALTGLPNRNLLNDRLDKLVKISKRQQNHFSLAMIDLDGFKTINDTCGHDVGDALLQTIASRLNTCIRSADTVARIGGDEFVLLLDGLDADDGIAICQRAAAEITKPVSIGGSEKHVGASIGIAVFPQHGDDPETLTRNADQAMYTVKAEGGGIRLYAASSFIKQEISSPSHTVPEKEIYNV